MYYERIQKSLNECISVSGHSDYLQPVLTPEFIPELLWKKCQYAFKN